MDNKYQQSLLSISLSAFGLGCLIGGIVIFFVLFGEKPSAIWLIIWFLLITIPGLVGITLNPILSARDEADKSKDT